MSHPLSFSADLRLGPLVDGDLYRRLCRSRDFLASHIEQPVRLQDAAREAFLSPFHFHRLFVDAFGETPHQFVSRLRIERAKRLLVREGMPVTDVCFAIGYESLGSFSTRFRSIVGASPSEYQRESRKIFRIPKLIPYRAIPACFVSVYGLTV